MFFKNFAQSRNYLNSQRTHFLVRRARWPIGLVLACTGIAVMVSCSANVGEQPPPPTAQQFAGAQCLSDTLPVVTDFIEGKASDGQVSSTWDCFSTALEQFKKRVIGRSQAGYTPGELAKFLEDNFFKFKDGKSLSPELQDEVMKFKQILIGGSRDSLTRKELDEAILLFHNLKTLTLKLNPFMKVYSQKWELNTASASGVDLAYFEQANAVLLEVAGEFADLVQKNNQAYDLADFPRFVIELNKIYDRPWEFSNQLERLMPMLIEVKNALFKQEDSILTKTQWAQALRIAARSYSTFMYEHYFHHGLKAGSVRELASFHEVTNRALALLKDFITTNPDQAISQEAVARLAQRAVEMGLLPKALDEEVTRIAVDVVLNRVLVQPKDRLGDLVPKAITLESIDSLEFELDGWLELEQVGAEIFASNQGFSGNDLTELLHQRLENTSVHSALHTSLQELLLMLKSPVPLTIDGRGHLMIGLQTVYLYGRESYSQLNLNRMIARVVIRSYAMDLDRINDLRGISASEVQTAFDELRPVGIALELLDPSNTTFPTSRFREANIFTARADGDNLASFLEASDLVGMIWSGLNVNRDLKPALVRDCLQSAHVVNFDTTVDTGCMAAVYRQEFPNQLQSLPGFINYMQSANADQWPVYFANVLKAAGYVPNETNQARMADVSLIPHVIQYIEMVFAKFDADGNNLIDTSEALAAFPSFKGILKELAGDQVPEDELDDIFTYILKYGKPPESVGEKLRYGLSWRNKPERWLIEADRTQLAKILGYIADQVVKTNAEKQAAGL